MTFNSGQEMLDMLRSCDLYSSSKEIYVFDYNLDHSIAYYYLSNDEMNRLEIKAKELNEYVGALLGPGGWIVDDPSHLTYEEGDYSNLDWCNDNFDGEWREVV